MQNNQWYIIKTCIFVMIGYFFLKNYQHNLFVKANYQKQRLELHVKELEKERNNALIASYRHKDPIVLLATAEQKYQMVRLRSRQLVIVDPTFSTTQDHI